MVFRLISTIPSSIEILKKPFIFPNQLDLLAHLLPNMSISCRKYYNNRLHHASEYYVILRAQSIMDCTTLWLHLYIFKCTKMQIRRILLMIVTLQPITMCFLALIFSHGAPTNNPWLLNQPKSGIVSSLMHQLK